MVRLVVFEHIENFPVNLLCVQTVSKLAQKSLTLHCKWAHFRIPLWTTERLTLCVHYLV